MARITCNIFSIDYDRRKEIIEKTINIKSRIDYENSHKGSYVDGIHYRLERASYLYSKLFKEYLNNDEKTILYLYLVFPDDKDFVNLLIRYNKDYLKIGELYGVSSSFVRLRHFNLVNMNSIKKTIRTLQIKNNS